MYLGWDKLTVANTKLVEIAVDLAGAACRNDHSGKTVADLLFVNETPIGKTVRSDGRKFKVIGVLAPKGSAFGQDMDRIAVCG